MLGQDSGFPSVNFDARDIFGLGQQVDVQGDHAGWVSLPRSHRFSDNIVCPVNSLIRTIGAASTVLLKNTNNVLPLKKPKSIAVIGERRRLLHMDVI